jgi:acetyltransferase-like isoleucine patch superfamily enzyme
MGQVNPNRQYAGRAKYERYRWAINGIVLMVSVLPAKLCLFLWSLSDLSYGNVGSLIRYCVLKKLAKRCGDRVYVGRGCTIRSWENLQIGSDVSIQAHCHIEALGGVTIGNHVSIAHQTSLLSTDHDWTDESIPIRDNAITMLPVIIHDDVWIGSGCNILSGVTVASRSIVAAGAVVTKSVPGRVVVGGVPAKVIKSLGSAG